jgi:hypothetical protein
VKSTISVLSTDPVRLEECFTAKELAELLAARNKGFDHWRARAFRAEGMLRQIAAGWFTEQGAKIEARRVIAERHATARLGEKRAS